MSRGSSAATRRLFCGCKLGWSSESRCYSRKGLFSCTFLLILLLLPSPALPAALISHISPEKKRCRSYCSSKEKKTALPFPFYLLASGCHVCVHMFSISPPDRIRFYTTVSAQHALVELVPRVIVCLQGFYWHCSVCGASLYSPKRSHNHNPRCRHLKLCIRR